MATERNKKPVDQGIELAKQAVEMMENLVGESKNNCLLAYRLQTLADGYRDLEKDDEAESIFRRA